MARDALDVAVELHERALDAWDEHRYPRTVSLGRRAPALFEAHAGAAAPDTANVLTLLGGALDELGDHAGAEAHHRRACSIMDAFPDASGDLLALRVQAGLGLGGCLRRQARYAEAERVYLGLPRLPAVDNDLGVLYKFAGRLGVAAECYTRALAGCSDPAELAAIWHNLAGLAHAQGDAARAEACALRSLELHRQAYPPGHPAIAADEAQLGAVLQALGRPVEAEACLRPAVVLLAERHGVYHLGVLAALHNLGAVRADLGDPGEAEALFRRALDGKLRTLGPDHPEVALTRHSLECLLAG